MPRSPIVPGLLVLHAQRSEMLAETVIAWLQAHPLAPLEQDILLVQSNGMAEWLKMGIAQQLGICAATKVELPGRFLWRTYRQVLGHARVPAQSPLDKGPLTWRLMQLLPRWIAQQEEAGQGEVAAPIRRFLWARSDEDASATVAAGAEAAIDPVRLHQLASRLADLFDQYQVYRADWLDDWAQHRDQLAHPLRPAQPLPSDQAWQASLWRAILAPLTPDEQQTARPRLHGLVVQALREAHEQGQPVPGLPRRVVVFGMSTMPLPILEAMEALSHHCQVLLAVPNPCRFHWADIMDGREMLRMARRRFALKGGQDLSLLPLEAMHAHAHPLLASWGRQGRDFVRQLDAFDDMQRAAQRFELPRLDLFDETPPQNGHWLAQVQAHIRDMVPLPEHPHAEVPPADQSIVFRVAHSPQRELEVLHDHLLSLLSQPAAPGEAPLQARDIVVMWPQIETVAPAIRAVFGQYGRHDPRHIPFDIADLSAQARHPLVHALEWLLRLPQQRCRLSELHALLEVPAIAARFGVHETQLPGLLAWMEGAGIRWGLDQAQRAGLGLAACGDQNSGWFGLRRMLLGFASGAAPLRDDPLRRSASFEGTEPYAEVAGLEAEVAGGLAELMEQLRLWSLMCAHPATPAMWAQRARALLEAVVSPQTEDDRRLMQALDEALVRWLSAVEAGQFQEAVDLAVFRPAWLDALQEPELNQRFRAGGVTFCTLMPMRAIPFRVVCLLGMNDGDYPRRSPRSDFDLMALPGQARAGDRSRRDDDRQLMLEALLSARQQLYLSWTGRSSRDQSELPPSVLVTQLRDYLAQGWTTGSVAARTQEHPLQAFSRRYFEAANRAGSAPLRTYAREWRAAHDQQAFQALQAPSILPLEARTQTVRDLTRWLQSPVPQYFAERLRVRFPGRVDDIPDEERFELAGLDEHGLLAPVVRDVLDGLREQSPAERQRWPDRLAWRVGSLLRAGSLPMGAPGERISQRLAGDLQALTQAWVAQLDRPGHEMIRVPLAWQWGQGPEAFTVQDWLEQVRPLHDGTRLWTDWTLSRVGIRPASDSQPWRVRPAKAVGLWLTSLLLAAQDTGPEAWSLELLGRDVTLRAVLPSREEAHEVLGLIAECHHAWRQGPLPLPFDAAMRLVEALDKGKSEEEALEEAANGYETPRHRRDEAEADEPCLGRLHPDFESLCEDGRFVHWALRLHARLQSWLSDLPVTPHPGWDDPEDEPEDRDD